MKPTFGGLFSGIGGMELGFQRAGFDIQWTVEIDPYCRKVLQRHFPDAERFEDVRNVDAGNLRRVDVIAGGFPCQDISNAGLRAGIDGERSGLWREYARIIGELRPKVVVVENVTALLGRGMGRVLGDLAALRYDAEWQVVSAASVLETDHIRERVWIVAYPNGAGLQERADNPSNGCQADGKQSRSSMLGSASKAQSANSQCWERSLGRKAGRTWWVGEPIPRDGSWKITHQSTLDRREDGLPYRLDQLRALGNAVVPQIPELIAHRIKEVLAYD